MKRLGFAAVQRREIFDVQQLGFFFEVGLLQYWNAAFILRPYSDHTTGEAG
jgi:hypothetical protein